MANFTPSKKTAQDFNGGVEYVDGIDDITGDSLHAEDINSVIESQLWTQALATNPVDNSEANNSGEASIGIQLMLDGTPQFIVKNIKGKTGVGVSQFVSQGVDANGGNVYNVLLTDGASAGTIVAPKGAKGDTGNGVLTAVTTYATSTSGTTAPSSDWQAEIPTVAKGSYLWTRTVTTYTNGTVNTGYTSAYQGQDGQGAVTSVNGETGAVTITPAKIGAVNKAGDTMTGPLTVPELLGTGSTDGRGIIPVRYITRVELGLTTVSADVYLQAWLKQVCELYPNTQDCIFIGMGNPSSRMSIYAYIYNTSEVNADGMPRYVDGFAQQHTAAIRQFQVDNYVYSSKVLLNNTENIIISNSTGSVNVRVERTDTGAQIGLEIGSGGTNRGLYDRTTDINKWIVYWNNVDLYLMPPGGNGKVYINGEVAYTDNNPPKMYCARLTFSNGMTIKTPPLTCKTNAPATVAGFTGILNSLGYTARIDGLLCMLGQSGNSKTCIIWSTGTTLNIAYDSTTTSGSSFSVAWTGY